MAVKFGVAFGAEVTVLSTSAKQRSRCEKLGAHNFIVTKDDNNLASVAGSFDFILDTVSAPHDLNLYLSLLRVNGVHICVGVPPTPYQVHAFSLIGGRRRVLQVP
jgi:uncharacterized zinc-type alcohol dehydrogenase-like protein